jgi:hypothetical protein
MANELVSRTYTGPVAEIETILDGETVSVRRGDTVDVTPDQADQLDRQPSNWSAPAAKRGAAGTIADAGTKTDNNKEA